MKTALITGISGQDGSYLSEHLLSMGYTVHGIVRRHSVAENQDVRIRSLNVHTHYGDLLDIFSLQRVLAEVKPDEIYNLAAMSHVRISFDMPSFTIQTNALGVLNILEAYRTAVPTARFYQASSSEMFGNSVDSDGVQRLTTPMNPVSPYGCAKLLGYNLVRHYRNAYKLHACNGILFNHESPRRGTNFVTNKVVRGAVEIYLGQRKELVLGNLDSVRDWGHAKDYTRGMHAIVNHSTPDDFIIASGEGRSVRDLCEAVFSNLGLDYRDLVRQEGRFMRPEELKYLRGDSSKIREQLGWRPEYTFDSMIKEMITYWMNTLQLPSKAVK
jgi:GDPmannose 4,6-dehydratase